MLRGRRGLRESYPYGDDSAEDNNTEDTSWLADHQPHEVYRDRGPHASHAGGQLGHPQFGMLTLHTGGQENANADPGDFAEFGGGAAGGPVDGAGSADGLDGWNGGVLEAADAATAEAKPVSKHFGTFGVATSAKSEKGQSKGYLNGVMYLAPAGFGGTPNYCPHASPGCKAACLFNSGRIGMSRGARQVAKTFEYMRDRRGFEEKLSNDIHRAKAFAKKKGYKLAVRLNGTSDIPFHKHGIFEQHPDVRFYDYTKDHNRMHEYLDGKMAKNYHMTYSLSETPESHAHAESILKRGGHVAVPFDLKKTDPLPKTWRGRKVLNGDATDLRFLDPKRKAGKEGSWVGLHAKRRTAPGAPDSDHGFLIKNPHLEP